MSESLDQGLKSVERDEYFSGLAHASQRQLDWVQAQEMMATFEAEYPGLSSGLTMIGVIAERNGLSVEEKTTLFQGACLALIGLKEIADMRKLKALTGE